ncbi:hypothetical protein SFRURICE_017738 [Spodoptera frugiperda]|nr:hypothetical protein SFRURICE_017738 [Spodoptera frugiperda]
MSQNNVYTNKVEEEYLDIVSRNAWALVYQKIGLECQRYGYTLNEAKKPQNKPLNRYRDVNPFDHTRVVLKRCERDYINANYVTVSTFQVSLSAQLVSGLRKDRRIKDSKL